MIYHLNPLRDGEGDRTKGGGGGLLCAIRLPHAPSVGATRRHLPMNGEDLA